VTKSIAHLLTAFVLVAAAPEVAKAQVVQGCTSFTVLTGCGDD
jgi:hypothetical protein